LKFDGLPVRSGRKFSASTWRANCQPRRSPQSAGHCSINAVNDYDGFRRVMQRITLKRRQTALTNPVAV
jgi:hypothetical protein